MLNLSNGFSQIPFSREAKSKTVFVTEEPTARFKRLSFGLEDAPEIFQKAKNL